jgi:uncharacterized protein (TIGR02145 family)
MKFKRLLYIATLILAVAACKKDEETETTPSLSGALEIKNLPEFIAPGQKCTLTAAGVEHPDGGKIGYFWKVSPSQTKFDTTDVFNHTFSDTLQTYTIYCYAYAIDGGYTNTSGVSYTTAVAPGYKGSIQKYNFKDYATDSIQVNNRQYYTKEIGEQKWTLNNMAEGNGIPFRNAEVMGDIFGRYYSFEEAEYACNVLGEGWTLPTLEDWNTLETYLTSQTGEDKEYGKSQLAAIMADTKFNGSAMCEYWPVVGDFTNKSGFTALPAGYANVLSKSFDGAYEYAAFWTATETNATEAYYKYTICDQGEIQTGIGAKDSFGASVRCIFKN